MGSGRHNEESCVGSRQSRRDIQFHCDRDFFFSKESICLEAAIVYVSFLTKAHTKFSKGRGIRKILQDIESLKTKVLRCLRAVICDVEMLELCQTAVVNVWSMPASTKPPYSQKR